MGLLSGAILVLAGSVLLGAGVVAEAVCIAANRFLSWTPGASMKMGGAVVVLGFVTMLVATLLEAVRGNDRRRPPS
jgi:hypothetical protein